jgi:metal-dependent hydrolase (beta-lactamase superfamily II)
MINDFEKVYLGLLVKLNSGWQPDEVLDDLALIVNSQEGMVIILGHCSSRRH